MRATRALRGAPPRSRSRRACAGSRRSRRSCGRRSIPTAERPKQILAAHGRRAPRGRRPVSAAIDNDLKIRLEKALADAALTERGTGEIFLQLNRLLSATRSTSGRRTSSCAISPSRIRKSAEAHFAVALAAYNGGAPEGSGDDDRARRRSTSALALKPDWERAALLKAEVLARKKPDEAIAFLAQVRRGQSRGARRGRRARAALRRAEALRRGARDVPAPVGQRPQRARVRVRRRRDLDADEGLGDGRVAVHRPEARELRRQRRRRALSRADRRGGRPLRTRRSSATRRCPKASATGSRSCASPR